MSCHTARSKGVPRAEARRGGGRAVLDLKVAMVLEGLEGLVGEVVLIVMGLVIVAAAIVFRFVLGDVF